jgi:glycosyltransferase involved in cell wall biosynthesis
MAEFLRKVIGDSGCYEPYLISLALSARDTASVRALSPNTWYRGPQILQRSWDVHPYLHVGCWLAELEFQRLLPRRILTEILSQFDLVQVVAGTPAWAAVTHGVSSPVCLFTATMIQAERTALFGRAKGLRRLRLRTMTWINASLERRALARTDCVFAESEYTRRLLAPYVAPDKVRLGPPGVDTTLFTPATEYQFDGYVLCVGRLADVRKNLHLLLSAYQLLCQMVPDAPRLVLAGRSGPTRDDLLHAESLGIANRIEVLVDLSGEQLRILYQGAALFVLSSDEEGLGIVLLEAMASGLPVVSTDSGGPATAIRQGETGLLTPVGDAVALAQSMHQLLASPDRRRQMGQAGRALVEHRFSVTAAGRVYLDVYNDLLCRRDLGHLASHAR